LALGFSTLAAYWPVRHNGFINFDDDMYIFENDQVKAGLTREGIVWAFTSTHAFSWHPLTWLSHMLDCELYGLNEWGHHLTNVVFHAANGILLFLVLNLMTGNLWASAFVAGAFALHPLHVESVAWASERKDVLSTFFWLLTMWGYVRYVRRASFGRYVLLVVLFGLGLLAKQMLVTLGFVLLLLDYWPLKRFGVGAQGLGNSGGRSVSVGLRRCILEKVPLFVLSGVASVIVFRVQQDTIVMKPIIEYPVVWRLANAVVAYSVYIGKMFWPARLAIIYPHQGSQLPLWQIGGSGLLLVGITTAVIWSLRRRAYLAVGWLWYLGTLVPVIGLVQVGNQAFADRYTYVPLTGLFIMMGWGLWELLGGLRYRTVVLSLSGVVLAGALGVLTWRQVVHWRTGTTVHEHATKVVANNWVAHNMLGLALASENKPKEAAEHYREALRIKPTNSHIENDLGLALVAQGETGEAIVHFRRAVLQNPDSCKMRVNLGAALSEQSMVAEAAIEFKEALRIDPGAYRVHHNLGVLLVNQKDLDGAIRHFEEAVKIRRDFADSHISLGVVYSRQGNLEEAIKHYRQALRIDPSRSQVRVGLADSHHKLGISLVQEGKLTEAMAQLREVLRINPDAYKVHHDLGVVLVEQKEPEEAISHFREALRIEPNFTDAHVNLGIVLARQGKVEAAIKHYGEAVRIDPNCSRARNNLADAYNNLGIALARQGRLDGAVSHFTKALAVKPGLATAHNNLGYVLFLQDKLDEALACYSKALALDPNMVNTHCRIASILERQGKTDQAIARYRKALEIDPNLSRALSGLRGLLEKESMRP
jgi:tetratricopeptide (TPR) repeat protein